MAPRKCAPLAPCPAGTANPAFSYNFLVFIFAAAVVMLSFYLNVRRVEHIQQSRAMAAGQHEVLNMVRTLLLRLQKAYGADTGRSSILVEPIVRVDFRGLGMTLRSNGKTVLANVSGVYQPGHLHAVMGPSGCGVPPSCRCPELKHATHQ
jgi:ABC-type multidrug transport system fused ATPase/permease subunit